MPKTMAMGVTVKHVTLGADPVISGFIAQKLNGTGKGHAHRSGMEQGHGFTIVGQEATLREGPGFASYTLNAVKDSQEAGSFSNLLITFFDDGTPTKVTLFTYYPTPGYLEAYAQDPLTVFKGKVAGGPIEYDGSLDHLQQRMQCYSYSTTYCNNTLSGGVGSTHVAGPRCERTWTVSSTVCYDAEEFMPPDDAGGGGNGYTDPNAGSCSTCGNSGGTGTIGNTSPIPVNLNPCKGNPVHTPEIAPSGGWNIQGGRFGLTRKRASGTKKFHHGIDIKVEPDRFLHNMFEGFVTRIRSSFEPGEYKKDSYGNFVEVMSIINGKTVFIKYNHLNFVAVKQHDIIGTGFAIGFSGNTGNAQTKGGTKVVNHVHIQMWEVINNVKTEINPEIYLSTKFNLDGSVNTNIDPCSILIN